MAKKILMYDLENGILSLHENEVSAEKAWDMFYRHLDDFQKVPRKQFIDQLKAHRKQINKLQDRALEEEVYFQRDPTRPGASSKKHAQQTR